MIDMIFRAYETIFESSQPTDWIEEVIKKYDDKKYCIHFTDIDKVGINPSTRWNTPGGVYGYPIYSNKVMLSSNKKINDDAKFFATNKKYAFLIESNMEVFRIEDISNIHPMVLLHSCTKLDKLLKSIVSEEQYIEIVKDFLKNDELESVNYASNIHSGDEFWKATLHIREYLEKSINFWTKLFIGCGIHWIGDTGGVIHPNEPNQRVHFTPQSFKVVDRFDNKHADFKTKMDSESNSNLHDFFKYKNSNSYLSILQENPQFIDRLDSIYIKLPTPKKGSTQLKILESLSTNTDYIGKFLSNNKMIYTNASDKVKDDVTKYVLDNNIDITWDMLSSLNINKIPKEKIPNNIYYYYLFNLKFNEYASLFSSKDKLYSNIISVINGVIKLTKAYENNIKILTNDEYDIFDFISYFVTWLVNENYINDLVNNDWFIETISNRKSELEDSGLIHSHSEPSAYLIHSLNNINLSNVIAEFTLPIDELKSYISDWNSQSEYKVKILNEKFPINNQYSVQLLNPKLVSTVDNYVENAPSKALLRKSIRQFIQNKYDGL